MRFDDLVQYLLETNEGVYRYSDITGSPRRTNKDTRVATSNASIKSLEAALQRHTKHKFVIFLDDTSENSPHIRYDDVPSDVIGLVINTSVFEDEGTEPPEAGFFGITPWMIGHRLGHLIPAEVIAQVVLLLCNLVAKNPNHFYAEEVTKAQNILKNPNQATSSPYQDKYTFRVGFVPTPPTISKLFAFKSAKRPFNYFYAGEYQGEFNNVYDDATDTFDFVKYKQEFKDRDDSDYKQSFSDKQIADRFYNIRHSDTPTPDATELYRDIFAQYMKFGKVTIRYPDISTTRKTSQEIESVFSHWLDTLRGSMWHLNFDPRTEELMGKIEGTVSAVDEIYESSYDLPLLRSGRPADRSDKRNRISDTVNSFAVPPSKKTTRKRGKFGLDEVVLVRGTGIRESDVARSHEGVPGYITGYKQFGFPGQIYICGYRVRFRDGAVAVVPSHCLIGPFKTYDKAKKYQGNKIPVSNTDLLRPLTRKSAQKDADYCK